MKSKTVDEFIETRVLPEFRPVVSKIRELMHEYAPEVQEVISYGIPSYRARRIVAVISPTKKEITLSFSRGAEFEDRYQLLQGVGKVSKHIKLRSLEDVRKDTFQYYMEQALKLDAKEIKV